MSLTGSEIPSRIPRPGGRGYEYVPRPGIPDEYPWYHKPILVNDRNIALELKRYTSRNSNRIARWLYSTWTADGEAIKYDEIRNALRDGEIQEAWIRDWQKSYARFIEDKLNPEWEKAWNRSSKGIKKGIKKAVEKELEFSFAHELAREWAESRAGERVVALVDIQKRALNKLLRHFIVEEPLSAEELGRSIRSAIGLTPKQMIAVTNYRSSLLADGTDPKNVEHLVGNYFGRLHRERALRIAQTEISYAYNNGQDMAMRQAQQAGLFGDMVPARYWDASQETNTCVWCQGMHGQMIGLDETYPHRLNENCFCPPAHPWCACGIIYMLISAADAANIFGAAA